MWARPSPQMTRPSTQTRSLSNRLREARRCRPRRPLATAEAVARRKRRRCRRRREARPRCEARAARSPSACARLWWVDARIGTCALTCAGQFGQQHLCPVMSLCCMNVNRQCRERRVDWFLLLRTERNTERTSYLHRCPQPSHDTRQVLPLLTSPCPLSLRILLTCVRPG